MVFLFDSDGEGRELCDLLRMTDKSIVNCTFCDSDLVTNSSI